MVMYKIANRYLLDDFNMYQQLPVLTKTITNSYPGHIKWINEKFLRQLHDGTRAYSFAIDYNKKVDVENTLHPGMILRVNHLAGCSLLKNTRDEKKICCLFVDPDYRHQGIATQLIKDSFMVLHTEKPLITVSEPNLPQLQKLLDKFGFELTSVKNSVYLPGIKEFYYNEGLAR